MLANSVSEHLNRDLASGTWRNLLPTGWSFGSEEKLDRGTMASYVIENWSAKTRRY